jgi:hypothetical protein
MTAPAARPRRRRGGWFDELSRMAADLRTTVARVTY